MHTVANRIVYDATAILGFGKASGGPRPEAKAGEVIIRYGGWSLQELRDSHIGKRLMREQDWYNYYPWSREKPAPGVYRLRVPVAGSNGKSLVEQELLLSSEEKTAPAVLVATALLVRRLQTGEDLLKGDWTRCNEQTADDYRVGLGWDDDCLFLNDDWDGRRSGSLWSSSARTS